MLPDYLSKEKAMQVRRELAMICNTPIDEKREITCDGCCDNDNCIYAWDLYNTDGDCLAMK